MCFRKEVAIGGQPPSEVLGTPACMRILPVIFIFLVTGCVNEPGPMAGGVLTIATVGDLVLIGYSKTRGTTGSFAIQSVYGGPLNCEGTFRYPSLPNGIAFFNCSDGQTGSIRIKADGVLAGEGRGSSEVGEIHVVYGYSISEMNERLVLPAGTRLVIDELGIGLVEIADE